MRINYISQKTIRFVAAITIIVGVSFTGDHALAQSQTPHSIQRNQWESAFRTYSPSIPIAVGVFTYIFNESWKHRQYIEQKFKDFEGTTEAVNIRKMLSDELQCIELFPFLEKPTHRFVIVESHLWAEALLECKCNATLREQYSQFDDVRDSPEIYKNIPAKKARIRDDANRFLDYLQQFERMIKSGVTNHKRLKLYLEPWIDLIKRADENVYIICPTTKEKYTPKGALLEYSDQE